MCGMLHSKENGTLRETKMEPEKGPFLFRAPIADSMSVFRSVRGLEGGVHDFIVTSHHGFKPTPLKAPTFTCMQKMGLD